MERKKEIPDASASVKMEAIDRIGSVNFPVSFAGFIIMEFMSRKVVSQAAIITEIIAPAVTMATVFLFFP
jgi:hypothetical protein